MTETLTPPDATSGRTTRSVIDATLLAAALLVAALGDVLGFNQLATQSPTDAIVQVVVVSVFAAGTIEAVRRVLFGRSILGRVLALPIALLAVDGFFAWRVPWTTGAMTLIVGGSGLLVGAIGAWTLWSNRHETDADAVQIAGLLAAAQGLLLVYFALLAVGDINAAFLG
jgi:hypothetical protein